MCMVCCCPGDSLDDVCLLGEDHGAASCESEDSVCPGPCPWSQLVVDLLLFCIFLPPCLTRTLIGVALWVGQCQLLLCHSLFNKSSFVCVESVDPFATMEYLEQRLKRVRYHAWLLDLLKLRFSDWSRALRFVV